MFDELRADDVVGGKLVGRFARKSTGFALNFGAEKEREDSSIVVRVEVVDVVDRWRFASSSSQGSALNLRLMAVIVAQGPNRKWPGCLLCCSSVLARNPS